VPRSGNPVGPLADQRTSDHTLSKPGDTVGQKVLHCIVAHIVRLDAKSDPPPLVFAVVRACLRS
jgi:hypothetical protein